MANRNQWEEREVEEFYNEQEMTDIHLLLLEDEDLGEGNELFDDDLEEFLNEIEIRDLVVKF